MSRKPDNRQDVQILTRVRPSDRVEEPGSYKVILHNDDYTTMEFVVSILMEIFRKSRPVASELMLAVHQLGSCVCGIYTYEIAETKVAQVTAAAKQEEFPLLATVEPE